MEKRLLVLGLFVSLACQAQLPIVPVALTSSSTLDYTNNLWVDVQTDTIASAGSAGGFPAQGAVMFEWTNIAPGNPNIGNISNSFWQTNASATWPYWTNNVTPLGKGAWSFDLNGNQNWRPILTGNGQPQPYTWVYLGLVRYKATAGDAWFDGSTGARTIISINNPTVAGSFFSGAGLSGVASIVSNRWDIWFVRNNGGTVVDMKTNNVDYIPNGSGTAGTAGSTVVNLGNDNTFVTPYKGMFCVLRGYHEIVSDANLSIIWTNLYKRYIGATPPR